MLAESRRVEVCPTKRLTSEAEALTTEPFKKMVWKLALPLTFILYAEGPVPPKVTFPFDPTYKACKEADEPVTKSPKEEVDRVVMVLRFPPNMIVFEEFVSPLANDKTGENEEVKETTPEDEMVISPETVAKYGEEEALPIKICPAVGADTNPTGLAAFPRRRLFEVSVVLPVPP
jgi:hypothetical protein